MIGVDGWEIELRAMKKHKSNTNESFTSKTRQTRCPLLDITNVEKRTIAVKNEEFATSGKLQSVLEDGSKFSEVQNVSEGATPQSIRIITFINERTYANVDEVEFSLEMSARLREKESIYQPKPYYFEFHPDLEPYMRTILVDWMLECAQEIPLERYTTEIAINCVDRFLSNECLIESSKLQLIGAVALAVASKVHEQQPVSYTSLASSCCDQWNIQQFILVEKLMSERLNWRFLPPTVSNWFTTILKIWARKYNNNIFPRKRYFQLMLLCDCAMLHHKSLQYTPSIIAASSIEILFGTDMELMKITSDFLKLEADLGCKEWLSVFVNSPKVFFGKSFEMDEEFLPADFHVKQMRNIESFKKILEMEQTKSKDSE